MIPSAGANAAPAEIRRAAGRGRLALRVRLRVARARPAARSRWRRWRRRATRRLVDRGRRRLGRPAARRSAPARSSSWVGRDVLLFANADEATVLTGSPDAAAAAQALAVRCGAGGRQARRRRRGLVGRHGGAVGARAAPAPVLDSTGAGDAFAAGFLADRRRGRARACAAAGQLAARAIAQPGARPPRA